MEPIRILQVCVRCRDELRDANQRHVHHEVQNEHGLERAKRDLKSQFDRPSNADYLIACQRMREGKW